jgi:methionine biosynthesis protein MetW
VSRSEEESNLAWSPDENAQALGDKTPDALRYDGHTDDPAEVAGLMRAAMPEGIRVLDVGCGTGSLTLVVNAGKGNRVMGVEPDPERADKARSRGLDVVTGRLDDAFLAEHGPFDAITFADVIEHLPAPAQVLETAVRGLSPGGLILISVPNVAHWSVRANLLVGRFDYEDVGIMDSTHLRWFTAKSLTAFVERAGLEIISVRQAAGVTLPVYGRSLFRLVPFRLLKPVIRVSARAMPRLFGSQHVLVARKPMTGAAGSAGG